MAKKKQLAGKTTKLAKLPLTQALTGQEEETAPWGPAGVASTPASQRALLSRDPDAEALKPLAAAYLYLIQELTTLRSHLLPPANPPILTPPPTLPRDLPDRHRLARALRQAREGLRDLHTLLFSA